MLLEPIAMVLQNYQLFIRQWEITEVKLMMILKEEDYNLLNHPPLSFICDVHVKNMLIAWSANQCDEKWVKTGAFSTIERNMKVPHTKWLKHSHMMIWYYCYLLAVTMNKSFDSSHRTWHIDSLSWMASPKSDIYDIHPLPLGNQKERREYLPN